MIVSLRRDRVNWAAAAKARGWSVRVRESHTRCAKRRPRMRQAGAGYAALRRRADAEYDTRSMTKARITTNQLKPTTPKNGWYMTTHANVVQGSTKNPSVGRNQLSKAKMKRLVKIATNTIASRGDTSANRATRHGMARLYLRCQVGSRANNYSLGVATVSDIVDWTQRVYPARLAESWDAVGLVCGWPQARVDRVLFCVDVTEAVVDQALADGTQLLVAHHPLLLRSVTSTAATDSRGRILHRLIGGDCALITAHTNADCARPGVSDALAAALGLIDIEPLVASPGTRTDKLVVFVPREHATSLLDALADVGAGSIGNYERCAYQTEGLGTFRPVGGAQPAIGRVGQIETVHETRLELVLSRDRRDAVVAALRAAHPYEEPAFDVVEMAPTSVGSEAAGLGRVGNLPGDMTLAAFTELVAAALPATPQGVRVAGDLARSIRRVAVCGGSGGSLCAAANASGAQAFVTADFKHHAALDQVMDGDIALVDVAHWASEYPWLWQGADQLTEAMRSRGDDVTVQVCTLRTDPWTALLRSTE